MSRKKGVLMRYRFLVLAGALALAGCAMMGMRISPEFVGVWRLECERGAFLFIHPNGLVVADDNGHPHVVFDGKVENGVLRLTANPAWTSGKGLFGPVVLQRDGNNEALLFKVKGEDREARLVRTERSLEEDPYVILQREKPRKGDNTPKYMPANFARLKVCYASPEDRVWVALYDKGSHAAVVRIGDQEERLTWSEGYSEGSVDLSSLNYSDGRWYSITKERRLLTYARQPELKGEQVGMPIQLDRCADFPSSRKMSDFVGVWKGEDYARKYRLKICQDGRILLERSGVERVATFRTQLREGLLFAYEDEGPDGKYEDWNLNVLDRGADADHLLWQSGTHSERIVLTRAKESGAEKGLEDELARNQENMKACRYAGVWQGGEGFGDFAFLLDSDGSFCLMAFMQIKFGRWTANPDGLLKVKFDAGPEWRLAYSPYQDTLQADTPQKHRGHRRKDAPQDPVRQLKDRMKGGVK